MILTLIIISFFAGAAFTAWQLTRSHRKGDGLPAGTVRLPGPKGTQDIGPRLVAND